MGDQGSGTDPCECIWTHEMAMRRLLNIIRNSQTVCNDNECYTGLMDIRSNSDTNIYLMVTVMLIVMFFIFVSRRYHPKLFGNSQKPNKDNMPPNPPPPALF